jgi:hypothetical protein
MKLGLRGGLTWAAVVAIGASACAADPGDDPKGDGSGAVTTSSSGGSSGSSGTSTGGGTGDDSSTVGTTPPPTDDTSDASMPVTSDDSTTPVVEAAPPPPSCTTCPLTVEYECSATGDPTTEIKPWYKITNQGTSPQALSELTVRYWYNVDASSGTLPQQYVCDYAQVDTGNGANTAITADVMGTFGSAPTVTAGADSYMEISFAAGAGSIPPGLTAQVQNRFHKNNYSGQFTQASDYSFDPSDTAFTASMTITLYRAGTLVWGVEPGGAAAATGDP